MRPSLLVVVASAGVGRDLRRFLLELVELLLVLRVLNLCILHLVRSHAVTRIVVEDPGDWLVSKFHDVLELVKE